MVKTFLELIPMLELHKDLFKVNYVNTLSNKFSSNAKLFADDTSIFLVVHDVNASAKELNDGSRKLMIGLSNEK